MKSANHASTTPTAGVRAKLSLPNRRTHLLLRRPGTTFVACLQLVEKPSLDLLSAVTM